MTGNQMEVFLPDPPGELHGKLEARISELEKHAGVLCKNTLRDVAAELRGGLCGNAAFSPLIVTGHQPIFYPPGIIIKDLLAHELAGRFNGTALNLVVDTDDAVISFDYPLRAPRSPSVGGFARKEKFTLNRPGQALKYQELEPGRRKALLERMRELELNAADIFAPDMVSEIRRNLRMAMEETEASTRVTEPGVRLRERWERENGINLRTIYVSDLMDTRAFAYFKRFIVENADEFRRVYNGALEDYRRERKIKNPAQPLPNLDARELPFWGVKSGRRIPLTQDMDWNHPEVYPRAVALTLFCRLFLCDIFIHGRGGGRYDQITDQVLLNFFKCKGAPFTVASATIYPRARADFPLESRAPSEIERDLRWMKFDPSRFLEPEHELRVKRDAAIASLREPEPDRRAAHLEFQAVIRGARDVLAGKRRDFMTEKERAAIVRLNREIFRERALPFIFYDLRPLMDAVRAYGEKRVMASA